MSIPITCKTSQLDFLGMVLYGAHDDNLDKVISASGKRCASLYNSEYAWFMADLATKENAPRNLKIATFFLLLNKDQKLREDIFNICPYKAGCFYKTLCKNVVPRYLENESTDLNDFVVALKDIYRNE